jgi:hypothetical protein
MPGECFVVVVPVLVSALAASVEGFVVVALLAVSAIVAC